MHRSRLIGAIVDCAREEFAAGVRFWAGALGATATPEPPWVMPAPTGREFCIAPLQTNDWPAGAITWPREERSR